MANAPVVLAGGNTDCGALGFEVSINGLKNAGQWVFDDEVASIVLWQGDAE